MKKYNFIILLVLLIAMAGGNYLVGKSQDTRKGATGTNNNLSLVLSPSSGSYSVGGQLGVVVGISSGSVNDKLDGFDINLDYDISRLRYIRVEMSSGYQLLNDGLDGNPGVVDGQKIRLVGVNMGTGSGGFVPVAKVWFAMVKTGDAKVNSSGGTILMNQTRKLALGGVVSAIYTIVGGATPVVTRSPTSTLVPPTSTPRPPTGVPVRVRPTVTPVLRYSCSQILGRCHVDVRGSFTGMSECRRSCIVPTGVPVRWPTSTSVQSRQ